MHEHSSALIINLNIQLLPLILTSKKILIVDDSNGPNDTFHKELENEGFAISILSSTEKELIGQSKAQLIIVNSKLNGEDTINFIKNFQIKHIPIITCSEWGKDKLSFQFWASDVSVVKAGDHKDLKLTIKEVLAQHS